MNYRWEAELKTGEVITKGGDISGAVRVSIIPVNSSILPRHDFVGLPFLRRHMKVFKRTVVGGFDKARFFAEHERNLNPVRLEARKARDAAGRKPEIKPPEPPPKPQKPPLESVQVIICDGFRIHVRELTGVVLMTPQDYELYL